MLLLTSLLQTLVFLPLAYGVYLSYEILMVTDLTVEGTFVLGAGIFARLFTLGLNQFLAIFIALLGGAIIGILVTMMQRLAKINSLIAGILAVYMLYSINFSVMNQPNISLLNSNILLQQLQDYHPYYLLFLLLFTTIILTFMLYQLLTSRFGLRLRAFGSNPHLLKKLGKNPAVYLGFGLAISNMLAALCGVMTSQLNGYADINMGIGMALTAIGAVVIGKKLLSRFTASHFRPLIGLMSCIFGAYIYFIVLNGFLALNFNPMYLKLLLGLVLVVFLSTAHYTHQRAELYATAD